MVYDVFCVYDSAIELYLTPFYVRTRGEALRMLRDTANDANHAFRRHPQDYSLYYLGQYYEATGQFKLEPEPRFVVKVLDLVE